MTYASLAWWGYASATDKARLEAFLRRSVRLGYRAVTSLTLDSTHAEADEWLFRRITSNCRHLLYRLLPPQRDGHYELRDRTHHNFTLPCRNSAIHDCNFLMRMLYKDLNYSTFSQHAHLQ